MSITREQIEASVFTWTKRMSAEEAQRGLEKLGDQGAVCWVENHNDVRVESGSGFTPIQRGDKVIAVPGSIYEDGTWGDVEFIVRKVGWDG